MKSILTFSCILIIVCALEFRVIPVSEAAGTRVTASSSVLDTITWSTCQYELLTAYLHKLAAKYSTISRLFSIGKSVSGRDLWVILISDAPIERPLLRPQVKFVGNIIGDSGPTCYILLKLIFNLLEGFKQERSLERRLLENTEIHILPNMNPDGFNKSIPGTCRGGYGRLNAAGVDLNRDFPDLFNFKEGKSFQPETLALMQWMEANDFVSSLSFLSGKLVVTYPFDSVPPDMMETMEGKAHATPDDDMFIHLATSYVRNVKEISTNKEDGSATGINEPFCPRLGEQFENGIINGAKWLPASGTTLDYNYEQGTFELMVGISCCRNENKTEKLEKTWEINKMALLKFIGETEYGLRGQIIDSETRDPIPRASIIKTNQNRHLNEGVHPMPWRSSEKGEFWRLILPGNYILQVRAKGYEQKSISFQITSNGFTILSVELDKPKKPGLPETKIAETLGQEPEKKTGLREAESSEIDQMGSDSNTIESEDSGSIEPSYSKVNLIVSSNTRSLCFDQLFYLVLLLFIFL